MEVLMIKSFRVCSEICLHNAMAGMPDCINHSCKTSGTSVTSVGSSVEHGSELTWTAVSSYSRKYFQGGGVLRLMTFKLALTLGY
ncbi:unnamed protein product [Ixodes persulcatus]